MVTLEVGSRREPEADLALGLPSRPKVRRERIFWKVVCLGARLGRKELPRLPSRLPLRFPPRFC